MSKVFPRLISTFLSSIDQYCPLTAVMSDHAAGKARALVKYIQAFMTVPMTFRLDVYLQNNTKRPSPVELGPTMVT
jgi:hypothetical protein